MAYFTRRSPDPHVVADLSADTFWRGDHPLRVLRSAQRDGAGLGIRHSPSRLCLVLRTSGWPLSPGTVRPRLTRARAGCVRRRQASGHYVLVKTNSPPCWRRSPPPCRAPTPISRPPPGRRKARATAAEGGAPSAPPRHRDRLARRRPLGDREPRALRPRRHLPRGRAESTGRQYARQPRRTPQPRRRGIPQGGFANIARARRYHSRDDQRILALYEYA